MVGTSRSSAGTGARLHGAVQRVPTRSTSPCCGCAPGGGVGVRRAERRIASAVLTLVNAALLLGAVIPAVSARSWPAMGDSDVQLLLGAPALVASAAMSVLVLRGMWRA